MLALVLSSAILATQAPTRAPANVVSGVVVDPTGAVLPGAQVELKSAAADQNQSTATDAVGVFRFDRVPQGRYDVVVSFEGFQPTTIRVVVGARSASPLRVTLPLARVTQEVTVGNAAAEVKTDTASNLDASTIDDKSIENLPVFNQDVLATMSRFLDRAQSARTARRWWSTASKSTT
jgi:Carboxypeptidase regulatory-like domain